MIENLKNINEKLEEKKWRYEIKQFEFTIFRNKIMDDL